MDQRNKNEEMTAQGRRERDHELRMQGVEEALESFRSTLLTSLKSDIAEEAVAAFNELVSLVKSAARERSARLYEATVTYGRVSIMTVRLGPTTSRDEAARLARSWMDGHAGVTSKGEPVRSVSVDVVESDQGDWG